MDGNVALGCGWCSGWDTKPCLTHLCLILEFASWLLSHLLFLPSLHKKNKRKKGRNYIKFLQLPHLFRVPNLWEKVISYRAHGSWCCLLGWRPQKLHEGKRNQRKESQGQISMLCQAAASSPWQQGWFSSCWKKTALEREMSEQHRVYKVTAPYLLKRRCICILVSSS